MNSYQLFSPALITVVAAGLAVRKRPKAVRSSAFLIIGCSLPLFIATLGQWFDESEANQPRSKFREFFQFSRLTEVMVAQVNPQQEAGNLAIKGFLFRASEIKIQQPDSARITQALAIKGAFSKPNAVVRMAGVPLVSAGPAFSLKFERGTEEVFALVSFDQRMILLSGSLGEFTASASPDLIETLQALLEKYHG